MNVEAHFLSILGEFRGGRGESGESAESQHSNIYNTPPAVADFIRSHGTEGSSADFAKHAEVETPASMALSANSPVPPLSTKFVEPCIPLDIEYFFTNGVEPLPDDLHLLQQHLPRASKPRNQIIREYIDHWHQAMNLEPAGHRKQNAGRRSANSWITSSTVNAKRFDQFRTRQVDLPNDFDKKEL